jgi:hypothetical protein
MPTSFKPEVATDGTGNWYSNALRFAVRGDAEIYVEDLACRWTSVRDFRVVPSSDPVTHRWDDASFKAVPVTAAVPVVADQIAAASPYAEVK